MGSITMWIILGSLIGVVAIFLVVASILDRKKLRKVKIEKAHHSKLQQSARTNVAIWVNLVVAHNNQLMKDFVPSVGKLKMSDIRDKAKKSLELLERRKEFKLAVEAKENSDLVERYQALKETNSNIWDSKLASTIAFFTKEEAKGLEVRANESTTGKGKKAKVNVIDNAELVATSQAFKTEAAQIVDKEYAHEHAE